jgi:hypothetical protein
MGFINSYAARLAMHLILTYFARTSSAPPGFDLEQMEKLLPHED